ncbi:uncharacterized protein CXQ87_004987 [Candidozyma duobushaemuli]|uniref:Phosphatidylinositol N-acetylglucosaminyltransferase n=2 Tax=Candidozyma TaxID=3303203 RepID=A0ABX8IEF6_9ASCO|nr:uncharacterized protein CXQ87_004987 [[Candida] duobushaemulonis]PVH16691.1 hypothetical protein CXQ87_004987 [[Candida] duobushaemulonis]QWU90440.1 hypothetical protein CA3LBN_004801 [[Candida] haemuloni]
MAVWKKLLYVEQPFPDNYTPASFLDQLKRNTTVSKYSFRKLYHDFSLVALYASLLLLVNLNFSGIYSGYWKASVATACGTLLAGLGLVALNSYTNSYETVKSNTVILLMLLLLSPVLRSLTKSTSSDSIWALSSVLTCLNVVCHDYALETSQSYRAVISTNLSFTNGIVLASRLSSSMDAFVFLVFATEVCILFPMFDLRLREKSYSAHFSVMLFVYGVVASVIYVIHGTWFSLVYVSGVIFVSMCLPWYFMSLQRYKNELQGPWDTAKPKINSA